MRNKNMKVAIFVNEINVRGGTHKQVLRLCQYLEKQKIQFSLLTKYYDPDKTYPEFQNYNIIYLKEKPEEWKKEYSFLKKLQLLWNIVFYEDFLLFRKIPKGTTIVNIHDNHLFVVSILAKIFRRTKIVWQINDLPHNILYPQKKRHIITRIEDFFARQAVKCADDITVNVTKNKTRVQEKMGRDAHVFYCGVDVNDRLLPHTYSMEGKTDIRLLSTGVFFPYRNYETLILATEQLRAEGYGVRLDIIGSTDFDKPYADRVCAMIEEKGLQDAVKVWGQVDEDTYAKLYNDADLFLFLNIDQSWGLAVFEAMSCGLPVLVSNSVGAIELLHDDEDAVILEPKDVAAICNAVTKLSSDEAYYNRISQKAMEAVKEFTWEKLYCERVEKLFTQQLNG